MTMPDTHEARCRELAELRARYQTGFAGTVPDPRFASLRGEHEWGTDEWYDGASCKHCGCVQSDATPYCLREDGDALDEAIAACDFLDFEVYWTPSGWRCSWKADFDDTTHDVGAPSAREAKSAALWKAVMS